jgi:DMSO reductase anchor subunit
MNKLLSFLGVITGIILTISSFFSNEILAGILFAIMTCLFALVELFPKILEKREKPKKK